MSSRLRLPLAICLAGFLATPAVQAEELPLRGVAEVSNGTAAPFAGHWSIVRPGGSDSALTCSVPTVIDGGADNVLIYRGIADQPVEFTLAEQDGATLWQGSEAQMAVWTGSDSFILYPQGSDGAPLVDDAMLYERCVIWPRESYDGAVPGAVEPFAGAWFESLPADRGAGPESVAVTSCDNPVRFEVAGATSIRQVLADGGGGVYEVAAREGETILPNGRDTGVVIWVSPDRWHLHYPGMFVPIDWNLPTIFQRCPEQ